MLPLFSAQFLNVEQLEWDAAQAYFAAHPHSSKLSRQNVLFWVTYLIDVKRMSPDEAYERLLGDDAPEDTPHENWSDIDQKYEVSPLFKHYDISAMKQHASKMGGNVDAKIALISRIQRSDKSTLRVHTFIQHQGVPLATSVHSYLKVNAGEAKLKIAQSHSGEIFLKKIIKSTYDGEERRKRHLSRGKQESLLRELLGHSFSYDVRHSHDEIFEHEFRLRSVKNKEENKGNYRDISVQTFFAGGTLQDFWHQHQHEMSAESRSILMVKMIESILPLQHNRVVHGDLKATNFMVMYPGNTTRPLKKVCVDSLVRKIQVIPIDLNDLLYLPDGERDIRHHLPTTDGYCPPEARADTADPCGDQKGTFSLATDIYSMAAIINKLLGSSSPDDYSIPTHVAQALSDDKDSRPDYKHFLQAQKQETALLRAIADVLKLIENSMPSVPASILPFCLTLRSRSLSSQTFFEQYEATIFEKVLRDGTRMPNATSLEIFQRLSALYPHSQRNPHTVLLEKISTESTAAKHFLKFFNNSMAAKNTYGLSIPTDKLLPGLFMQYIESMTERSWAFWQSELTSPSSKARNFLQTIGITEEQVRTLMGHRIRVLRRYSLPTFVETQADEPKHDKVPLSAKAADDARRPVFPEISRLRTPTPSSGKRASPSQRRASAATSASPLLPMLSRLGHSSSKKEGAADARKRRATPTRRSYFFSPIAPPGPPQKPGHNPTPDRQKLTTMQARRFFSNSKGAL